jgi:hypothetical protein
MGQKRPAALLFGLRERPMDCIFIPYLRAARSALLPAGTFFAAFAAAAALASPALEATPHHIVLHTFQGGSDGSYPFATRSSTTAALFTARHYTEEGAVPPSPRTAVERCIS